MRIRCQDNQQADRQPAALSRNLEEGREAVLAFVRTPFAVRCNIVKVWRAMPHGLWESLGSPADVLRSRQRERWAIAGVVLMAAILTVIWPVAGRPAPVGSQWHKASEAVSIGAGSEGHFNGNEPRLTPGAWPQQWCLASGAPAAPAIWVMIVPLLGWAFVRLLWIPWATKGKSTHQATLAFARHLSGVYLFVYLMIFVGTGLLWAMILARPAQTEGLRWCLWWFLFGESFFVPAAMWLRLVVNNRNGSAFGQYRHEVLAMYLIAFVVIPVYGMVSFFW